MNGIKGRVFRIERGLAIAKKIKNNGEENVLRRKLKKKREKE